MTNQNEESRLKGKIVLIKGFSQYNVLRLACDLMAKGFEDNGYEAVVLDVTTYQTTQELIDDLQNEMATGGKFIFSYNGLLHNLCVNDGRGFYDAFGCPVFGFLVDHPYYHTERLQISQGENMHIGCIDADHISYLQSYYPNLKHVSFIPHFSFTSDEFIPYEKRKTDIYFPGSYKNPDSYKEKLDSIPKVYADIAIKLFGMLIRDSYLTLEEALRRYLESVGFQYTSNEFLDIINYLFFTDHYVRDYRRHVIVKTILEAGIPLTVSGNGWEQMQENYKDKLTIVGAGGLDIEENIKLIADTKILFNILPNFKNGTHERVFTAMTNGCLCFTDTSGYLLQNFENNENIVFYDRMQIDQIPKMLLYLLKEEEISKKIAYNGYQNAIGKYDNKATARHVLDIMGLE